jgi:DNA-binding response OmpR family regulator/HPt (histidine-containing phosphotransfer) domain-containing protein
MLCLILYSAIVTPQSKPMRVLVVDDDPMSRDLLRVLLQAEGYAVECAESGDAALTYLRNSTAAPGLVLVDAQMPGLAGPQLAGKLRRACTPATLLLAMSASRPSNQVLARFDGFLLKPFNMKDVAAALAARNPSSGVFNTPATRPRWTVVTGPASRSPSNSRLISIQASAPQPASRKTTRSQSPETPSAGAVLGNISSGVPVLNQTIYRQLAASMPAPQLHQMYALCVDDARGRIRSMRQLAASRDAAAFVRQAHAIKGGCGMLGATELHALAAQLEADGLEAAATSGTDEVNSLDELTAACDRLERILGSRV